MTSTTDRKDSMPTRMPYREDGQKEAPLSAGFAEWLVSQYMPIAGGATNNFIPQIWSARILETLRKALVFAQANIVNRDYEGEIQAYGDTVKINTIGDPTIFDYTKNTDMPRPESLQDSQKVLQIDQAKGFNFEVDDVDKAQQNPKVLDFALSRAAYKLADTADQFVGSQMVAGSNVSVMYSQTSPLVAPTPTAGSTGAYENLVDMSVKLDEQNVPTDQRWAVVPPWYHGVLVKDQRFVSYAAVDVLYNRMVGQAAGFNVLVSNNVPTVPASGGTAPTTPRHILLAGHQMSFSYAEQINQVEAYRPEARFADAVKGLHLYGGKVIRPEALVSCYTTRSNA